MDSWEHHLENIKLKTSDNWMLLECPTVKLDLMFESSSCSWKLIHVYSWKVTFLVLLWIWVSFGRIWLNSRTNLIIQVEISMNYQWIYHWYFHFAIFEFIQFHSIWFGSAKSDFKPEIAHNPAKNQSQFDWFRKFDLRTTFEEYIFFSNVSTPLRKESVIIIEFPCRKINTAGLIINLTVR